MDRLGFLVGVQLEPCDVLDGTIRVLAVAVTHNDRHLGEAELACCGDAVKPGDELVALTVGAHDERHDQSL